MAIAAQIASASSDGRIEGTVRDSTGGVVRNAAVTVVDAATALKQATTTANNGRYAFPVIPVGRYSLQVLSPGFAPYNRTGINIDANTALVIDAAIEPADRDHHRQRKPGTR